MCKTPDTSVHEVRKLTDHKINELNEAIDITVLDAPGHGNASHIYEIDLVGGAPDSGGTKTRISFQNGPVKEVGFNGITQEALIAITIDRLRSFQAGQYACRDNAIALTHLEEAQMWLQKRTRERVSRGVEGTHQK